MAPSKVALCPYMGVGHVMPMLHLANKLVSGIPIIFLFPGQSMQSKALNLEQEAETKALDIQYEFVDFSSDTSGDDQSDYMVAKGLRDTDVDVEDYVPLLEGWLHKLKLVRLKLEELKSKYHLLCLLLDPFMFYKGIVVQNIDLPIYAFIPFSMTSVVAFRYCIVNDLDLRKADEHHDIIPGLTMHSRDILPTILKSSSHPRASAHADRNKWMQECACGILFNSWEGIETPALLAALNDQHLPKPIYAIGPLLPPSQSCSFFTSDNSHCSEWLDQQQSSSVLFICFGSWITLSDEQNLELAMGLKASMVPFLWVLKSGYSPHWLTDFKEKTNRGLVISGWAPQQHILSHPAVGAFAMTCGWNTVIESIVLSPHGIALMAWPLYFDHLPTCRLIVDGLKIGAEVEAVGGGHVGLVRREEVAAVAKLLITTSQGAAMRRRAMEMKSAACSAVAQGGSSHQQLQDFVQALKEMQFN